VKIEIITPEKTIFEGNIKSMRVPGKKGSFQVLKDHAPIISTLDKGMVVVIDMTGAEISFEIESGIVEVRKNQIILLVESVG